MKNRVPILASLSAFVVLTASTALAGTPPPPATVSGISNVIDLADLSEKIAVYGGTALALAFAIGAGFIIAKKAFRWMVGKV